LGAPRRKGFPKQTLGNKRLAKLVESYQDPAMKAFLDVSAELIFGNL
jgi:hypothetical protein